jgi:hypothetical protein
VHDNAGMAARRAHAPRSPYAALAGDLVTGIDFSNPGDHDLGYLARRRQVAEITLSYVEGQPVPIVDYTDLGARAVRTSRARATHTPWRRRS